jgi:hypothetical protein
MMTIFDILFDSCLFGIFFILIIFFMRVSFSDSILIIRFISISSQNISETSQIHSISDMSLNPYISSYNS